MEDSTAVRSWQPSYMTLDQEGPIGPIGSENLESNSWLISFFFSSFYIYIYIYYTNICLSASRDSVVCADPSPQNSIGFAKCVKETHETEKKLLI